MVCNGRGGEKREGEEDGPDESTWVENVEDVESRDDEESIKDAEESLVSGEPAIESEGDLDPGVVGKQGNVSDASKRLWT